MNNTSKPFSILLSVMLALALLTGAIAAPILCRPFYYAHIGPLGLEGRTGLTRDDIAELSAILEKAGGAAN